MCVASYIYVARKPHFCLCYSRYGDRIIFVLLRRYYNGHGIENHEIEFEVTHVNIVTTKRYMKGEQKGYLIFLKCSRYLVAARRSTVPTMDMIAFGYA